ncbi:hypothetical protein C8J56DRAFT_1048843 [Mycena floridula]|nr:hypothetical protein C8J56DRAFT_1048843 [Mycena floridula]
MANPNAAYLMLPPWERLALEVWDLIGDEIEALDDRKVTSDMLRTGCGRQFRRLSMRNTMRFISISDSGDLKYYKAFTCPSSVCFTQFIELRWYPGLAPLQAFLSAFNNQSVHSIFLRFPIIDPPDNLEDTVPKHVTQFNRLDTFPLHSFTLITRSLLDYELPQFIAQFSTLDEFKIHCIDFVKHHDTMKLSMGRQSLTNIKRFTFRLGTVIFGNHISSTQQKATISAIRRLSSILPIDWKRIEMLTITYHGSAYNLVGPALAPLVQACASNVQTLEIRLDERYSGFLFEHMISLIDLSLIIPISQPQICTSVLTRTPNLKNFHLCLLADDHMSGDLQGWKELGHLDDWISPKLGNVQRRRRWTLRPIEGGSELSFEQMVLFRKTMLQVARKGWTGRGWASPDDFGESFEDAEYLSEPDDSVGRPPCGIQSFIAACTSDCAHWVSSLFFWLKLNQWPVASHGKVRIFCKIAQTVNLAHFTK